MIDKYLQINEPCVGDNIVGLKNVTSALKNEILFVYILGDHVIMIDWYHLHGIVHEYV